MTGDLPQKLRMLRESKRPRKSARTTSELMGFSHDTLRTYERGEKTPGAESLKKIAYYYGVSTDYLLGEQAKK